MSSSKAAVAFAIALIAISIVAGVGAAQQNVSSADLYIVQESYVESGVGVNDTGGVPTYEASGSVLRITPQNFNTSDVIDFGKEEQVGTLEFDSRSQEYILEPQGQSATFHLFWVTRERQAVVDNGSESVETVRVEYRANVDVTLPEVSHVPPGELSQLREDSANWTELVDEIRSRAVAGPDANIENELQSAIAFLQLLHNPLAALTGQFTAIIITLFVSLGGLLVLALFGLYHLGTTWYEKSYVHRTESLEATREDIDSRIDTLTYEERKNVLANRDWNDIFDSDTVAAAFRRVFGDTVLDGWLTIQEIFMPETLIHDRIQAMGKAGYEVVVTPNNDGEITDAWIRPLHTSDAIIGEGEMSVRIDELDEGQLDEVVEHVDWDDEEMLAFDLPDAAIDRSEISTTLESPNVDRLMEKIDEQVGPNSDFDSRQEFLEYIVEFIADIRRHPYTDRNGAPKPVRHILEMLLHVSHHVSGRFSFPQAEYMVENLELILMEQDIGRDVVRYVDEVESGKHG